MKIRWTTPTDLPELERLYATIRPDSHNYFDFREAVSRSSVLTDDEGNVIAGLIGQPVNVAMAFLLVDPKYVATPEGWQQVRSLLQQTFRSYRQEQMYGVMLMFPPALSEEVGSKVRDEMGFRPSPGWSFHYSALPELPGEPASAPPMPKQVM